MSTKVISETVLLYGYGADDPEGQSVQAVFNGLHILCREITQNDIGQSVGILAGLDVPSQAAATQEIAPDRIDKAMVFAGLTEQRLREVLPRLREAKAGTSGLKAMLTAHNQHWRFCDLLLELSKERAAFQQKAKK